MRRTLPLLLIAMLLTSSVLATPRLAAAIGDISIQDTPTPLVGSDVTDFALAAPKIFWHTGIPACPPRLTAGGSDVQPAQVYTESISRIATYGSTTRQVYAQPQACDQGQITSNIVADANFIYWSGPQGLMKLSVEANPGDAPQVLNGDAKNYSSLALGTDKVFALTSSSANTTVVAIDKATGGSDLLVLAPDAYGGSLSFDDIYIYYLTNGNLRRKAVSGGAPITIATGVTGYYAEGQRFAFTGQVLIITDRVYIGQGRTVVIYNNRTNTLGSTPIYTSDDASASVYNLTTDGVNLFVFERVTTSCGGLFCSYNDVLKRMTRSGASPVPIYSVSSGLGSDTRGLTTDRTFLFWQEGSAVQRLPNNAAALPVINMRVTNIEVTQGVQNLNNSVSLIQKRRTFVRVYVKSDGAAVPGVTAWLSSRLGLLKPINSSGLSITVRATPDRNDLNQSFLFELPWDWTTQGPLQLTATLNPFKFPLEPNYSDNTSSTSNLAFKTSPSLSVQFFRLNYKIGNTVYSPSITADVLKTYSWIMRAYPIGGTIGQNFKPTLWDVAGDTKLGNWVNQSSGDCTKSKIGDSDLSLCASYYTNGWLKYYRDHAWVPNTTAFYYGMISDTSNNFPRGQAIYDKTSVGPAGKPGQFFSLGQGWDTDGTYADWYAGHEIGHSLGRAHPNPGSTDGTTSYCGHSRSDPSFPYGDTTHAKAPIGPSSGSMEGFDVGDPSSGVARAVYPSSTWNDVMSYCSNQWLSDYTYNGMYSYMTSHPSLVADQHIAPAADGDFLSLAGIINPAENSAGFSLVRRLTTVANQPALVPGDYSIRLLDATNGVLADYAFTPTQSEESQLLGFDQVVNFVPGTRVVQIVRQSDGQVFGSYAVSANPPAVSDVALQGAPDPVSGVVTLGWNASDPDNDALTFDIFYSRDNGATFQPVAMDVTGTSTQIDTAKLGGSGTAILRVVANDGANTAEANSAPFTMANKAPEPYILTPGASTHIHYGQLVNFSGMAFDAQDSTVGESGLVWTNAQGTTVGTGALISLDNLPVGNNVITLTATNSVGVAASTSVTVIVDDDLNLPGPTLTAGPGQIGWQVEAGSTTAQTAQVSISNTGSGTLNWTASSDQPWLTLSAANGSIADGDPFILTLTADPSSLPANQTASANLTLTKPEDSNGAAQTIVIPVSLSVGDVRNNVQALVPSTKPPVTPTPPASERKVYLPIVVK